MGDRMFKQKNKASFGS